MSKIPDIGELQDRLTERAKSDPGCSALNVYLDMVCYLDEVGADRLDVHLLKTNCLLATQAMSRGRGDRSTIQACKTLAGKLDEIEERFGSTIMATAMPRLAYHTHTPVFAFRHFLLR